MLFFNKIPAIVISLFALVADLQGACVECEDVKVKITGSACIEGTFSMTLNGSVLISIFGSAFSTIEGRKKL